MRNVDKDSLTTAFLGYMSDDTDARTKYLLTEFVTRMHDFIRATGLTHDEWRKALELLFEAGEISTAERNEFVLFSDVLGISSLVDMINSSKESTPSSVLGPFHVLGAPEMKFGADLKGENEGDLVVFGGCVLSNDGQPIEGVELEIWQTAYNGLYSGQDAEQADYNLRGRMVTGANGQYLFSTVRPAPYTVPEDGPVGELLRATGRHPWRPSHLHFIATAAGYRRLVTEVFPSDDPYLDEDAVFGVREQLVMDYQERTDASYLPDELEVKDKIDGTFYEVDFDFTLSRA